MRILILKATPSFSKELKLLVLKENISQDKYIESRDIFKSNPKDQRLRPHKINCTKNQNIIAIDIKDTQYRILANYKKCDENFYLFSWIGKQLEYERIIKDKKNCKSLFVNCQDLDFFDEV